MEYINSHGSGELPYSITNMTFDNGRLVGRVLRGEQCHVEYEGERVKSFTKGGREYNVSYDGDKITVT